HLVGPSAWLHATLPVFRSYARFGVVVQLMAAIAAGAGFDRMREHAGGVARAAAAILVVAGAIEYMHWPWYRDVLPTEAHRSMMRLTAPGRAVECGAADPASSSVEWLSRGRIAPADPATLDCAEPDAAAKVAAVRLTHATVPRGPWQPTWLPAR